MDAGSIHRRKQRFPDGTTIEEVIWQVPEPVPGSAHHFKYRLYFGVHGKRVIGYDNERGKGDHRHVGKIEEGYEFTSVRELLGDFRKEVALWRATRTHDDHSSEP